MRTGKITIKGKEYLTCFSTRVLMNCEERAGSFEHEMEKIEGRSISECIWLIYQLIIAGDRYAKIEGIDNPEPMTYDELIDSVGVDEYPDLFKAITATTTAGTNRNIELKASKNAEPTQDE